MDAYTLTLEDIATYPINYDLIYRHLNIDDDIATADEELIEEYVKQAFDAFERATECAIVQRTATIVYTVAPSDNSFRLPFGPVASITSVNGEDYTDISNTRFERIGTLEHVYLPSYTLPLTIVYEVGYATLPHDIHGAIWWDVCGRYEERGPDGKNTNAFDKVVKYDRIVNRHRRGRGLL